MEEKMEKLVKEEEAIRNIQTSMDVVSLEVVPITKVYQSFYFSHYISNRYNRRS